MVEYRLYLPGFGFVLTLTRTFQIISEKVQIRKLFPGGSALIIIILSTFTFQRNEIMKEAFLVWKDAATKSPHNIRAQTAYATHLKMKGYPEDALSI